MEGLDLKQLSTMVDLIAEEKGLPRDIVLNVIEQAIAAAWRKDNGTREMNVRAMLNTKTGEADVFISREVIEDDLAYNPNTEIPLKEAKKQDKNIKIGDTIAFGTGGMETKIQAAEKVTEYGIEMLLANGGKEKALTGLLDENSKGTLFSAE